MKIEKGKTLKITPPDGYEVDKEKSTFDNIVFKRVDEVVVIKWDARHFGVEIKSNGEHFIIGAYQPSYCCSWNDAVRYHSTNKPWVIPTVKQLHVLAKHLDKVNEVIREYKGYEILGCLWSCEEDGSSAWCVDVDDGLAFCLLNCSYSHVRAVYAL